MEYFSFGETFIEEHKNSHNSTYKFNGKELDEESGDTYFGARYLDMRYSIWNSTDPLSGYNPIFEDEHYFDFEHNLGVLNSFNHATYSYCYQNPINLFDPNGKQSKAWNRTMGALQGIGGVVEIVGSGVGEWFSGGTATPLMMPLFLNGVDNAQAGFRQLWTGETTETMLHKGTKSTAKALGASDKNAESIANFVDLSTILLGNVAALKNGVNLLKSGGKIITSGKQHGTLNHWNTMLNLASKTAKGSTTYLNKAINTALGKNIKGIGNWRPDILTIAKNGVLNITEVISPSQTSQQMIDKVNTMADVLRKEGYKVNVSVVTETGKKVN